MGEPRRRHLLTAWAALLGVGGLGPRPAVASPTTVRVEIRDYQFQPASVSVPVGSTVRWVNREKRTTHTVRFTGPGAVESERLFPDEAWERRFDRPGRFPYECGPHPEMKGEVVVLE